jgi:twitching motility protein PilT
MSRLLQTVVSRNASDLHMIVGRPPVLRLSARLRPLDLPPLEPKDTQEAMEEITPKRYQQELVEVGGADFGYDFGELARFRVSIYRERGHVGMSLRLLPSRFMTFEEIGLPQSVKNLLYRRRGLVLVVGPTGCGKTTTLATMLDFINSEMDHHIITVEDPIEYIHQHKKSIVTQRELGIDVPTFAEAIRRGLRMDPDVFLVGEMRDLTTMEAAITAAETGHLVFATLHTTGAADTVNRIIDAFPVQQQEQIRAQLSVSLLAVLSEELMPRADSEGLVAAFEVMVMTSSIAHQIRERRVHQIDSEIQTGRKYGMIALDDFLFDLYTAGKVTYAEMIRRAQDPESLQRKIKEKA